MFLSHLWCSMANKRLIVCVNERLGFGQKSCAGSGSRKLINELQRLVSDHAMQAEIVEQVCLGRCEEGINMRIAPGGPFFTQVTQQDLLHILLTLKDYIPVETASDH